MVGLELIACSGARAFETIAVNIAIAQQMAIVTGLLCVASLAVTYAAPDRIRYTIACLMILLFHPAWTVSAYGGDCGSGMAGLSAWALIIAALAFLRQVGIAMRRRKPVPPAAGNPGLS